VDEKPENFEESDVSGSRRGFIRKAVYAAPALIVLGSLTKSNVANAAPPCHPVFGCPPSLDRPPNGTPGTP